MMAHTGFYNYSSAYTHDAGKDVTESKTGTFCWPAYDLQSPAESCMPAVPSTAAPPDVTLRAVTPDPSLSACSCRWRTTSPNLHSTHACINYKLYGHAVFITDRISRERKVISSICPSICFNSNLLNRTTFGDLSFCTSVGHDFSSPTLEFKLTHQDQPLG